MEQILMILVFAITAAVCLKGFAAANTISLKQERMHQAVVLAQNAAETLKATCGDYEALDSIVQEDDYFVLTATPNDTSTPFLGSADIQVYYDRELLFRITTAWQEVP